MAKVFERKKKSYYHGLKRGERLSVQSRRLFFHQKRDEEQKGKKTISTAKTLDKGEEKREKGLLICFWKTGLVLGKQSGQDDKG